MSNLEIVKFQDMIYERLVSLKERVSNCIGTALYLVGELEEDRYIWMGRGTRLFKMMPYSKPIVGAIVSWNHYTKGPYHMAVVTSLNPLKVTQRDGERGPVETDVPLTRVDWFYLLGKGESRTFHLPRKLEKALNEK